MTDILVPDADLLARAVRTFMAADTGSTYAVTPNTLVFVALTDDEVSGWCWGYQLIRPDDSSMLYLHQLQVSEPFRRRGIGRALLQSFISAGTAAGAGKMFLTTGADNTPARTLYESMGAGLASQGPTANYWFLLTT